MKISLLFLVLPLLLPDTVFANRPDASFPMNGWQIHSNNIRKVEEAIRKAPEYNVNFFIFSHELFRSVEGFLASPDRRRDINYLGDLSTRKNIAFYLWVHELDDIPARFRAADGRVDLDNPEILAYLTGRYERLVQAVPDTAGFVLTFHESGAKIFRNAEVKSRLSVPDRIRLLTQLIYDVAKRHGKRLILRNFFYEPGEMHYFSAALSELPDDIIVMRKNTCHEFDPFYPADPTHGTAGPKKEIMELDLGVEKAWGHEGVYCQVEDIRKYVLRAREKGLSGMVGRARLYWDQPFENPHEMNLYAFSRLMEDPTLDVERLWKDWALRHYPVEAAPHIVSALRRTEWINHHGRYHLGFWLTKFIGEDWDYYPYYFGHIRLRSLYKWTGDEGDLAMEQALYHPDRRLFDRLVAEKDEVIAQVRASQADLEQAFRYLTAGQARPLRQGFDFLLDSALLARQWTRAFFGQRLWMDQPTEDIRVVVDDALSALEDLDRASHVRFGLDPTTGHRYSIDRFVLEMRWRMVNRGRALEEDKRILGAVEREIKVEQN